MGDNLSFIRISNKSVVQVATGDLHNCALLDNSKVKCWGLGRLGRLGNENERNYGDNWYDMGFLLPSLDLGKDVKIVQITTKGAHTCARLSDRTAKCWGQNSKGQLGTGSYDYIGRRSGQMGNNLKSINIGTQANIKSISTGGSHTCVVTFEHKVKCFGEGRFGQTGLNHNKNTGLKLEEMGQNLPYLNLGKKQVKEVFLGTIHSCALFMNGQTMCWGNNRTGQLGLGHTLNLGDEKDEINEYSPYIKLGSTSKVRQLALGTFHTCALFENHKVKCWGLGRYGQTGLGLDGTIGNRPNQMGQNLAFLNLGNNRKVVKITAGSNHTCALFKNGKVKCWGKNNHGQLGLNHSEDIGVKYNQMGESLKDINLGQNLKAIDISAGSEHTCAILENGKTKCWGIGLFGVLGQGNEESIGDGI
jgi:alpha-tubulin suppressor-like RCC1 family protein